MIARMFLCLVLCGVATACRRPPSAEVAGEIIALERGALERWNRGDPRGYLELFDSAVTYFDPFTPARVDGLRPMEERLLPITGQVSVPRYEMLNPTVAVEGDIAVLTFNLVSYARGENNSEQLSGSSLGGSRTDSM